MLQEGELAISLVAPQQLSLDAAAGGASSRGTGAAPAVADLRTPAMARWTALPAFSFTDTASRSSVSEAEGAAPQPPLVAGELLYYPASTARLESRAPILLGTFSVPPPASHSASTASASYTFHVPLRTSPAGARWMAMGDCWVRGGVETWEEASAKACTAAPVRAANTETNSAFQRYAPLSSPERQQQQRVERVNHSGAIAPASVGVTPLAQQHLVPPPTPPEDIAMQRVRERQEALLHRVEFRLAEVRQQRANIQAEMAAQDAAAAAEESAIVEEYGLLEAQQLEVDAAYREAAAQLAELQQLHADQTADQTAEQEAYLAEQTQALEEVAQERAEAVELRAQLEALQVQMKAHMAAEQQRYDARVERTRAAIGRVEANARWLTEVEAKIAAAECDQERSPV